MPHPRARLTRTCRRLAKPRGRPQVSFTRGKAVYNSVSGAVFNACTVTAHRAQADRPRAHDSGPRGPAPGIRSHGNPILLPQWP